jgi:hypothetical protein
MLQTLIVVLLVGVAAAYIGRRAWLSLAAARRARTEPGCASNCGCSPSAGRPKTVV